MKITTIKTAKGLEKEIEKNGKLHGLYKMPDKLYRSAPGVAQSALKKWIETPHQAHYEHVHGKKDTEAIIFGKRFDMLVTDRDAFGRKHLVTPSHYWKEFKKVPPKRTQITKTSTRWKELKKENPGKTLLTEEEFRQLAIAKRSFLSHPKTKNMITDHWQICAFATLQGIPVKGMVDNLAETRQIDVKTTYSCDPAKFKWIARDFGYGEQAGWYDAIYGQFLPKLREFWLVVVESGPPYRTQWFRLLREDMDRGVLHLVEHLQAFIDADYGKKSPPPTKSLILEIPERREHGMQEEF